MSGRDSNNLTPVSGDQPPDFAAMLAAYFEDDLSADDLERFNATLAHDNFARELFVAFSLQRCAIVRSVARERIVQTEPTANEESESQSILLEALEVERHARQKQQRAEAEREAQRLIAEAERRDQMRALLGQNEPVVPVRHIVIPRVMVYGTAAALAAMLLMLASLWLSPRSSPTTPTVPPTPAQAVAAIDESIDARWADRSLPTAPDSELHPGRYVLTHGLVRIRFASGVSAILTAPATLELLSADRVALHDGALAGNVPPDGIGFTVRTPAASIVDLGTEFGVRIDEQGGTHVQVFQGKVAVKPQSGDLPSRDIVQGEARRIDADGMAISEVRYDGNAFVRDREFDARIKAREGSAYHAWLTRGYELRRDPALLAYYTFERDDARPLVLPNMMDAAAHVNGELDGVIPLAMQWGAGRIQGKSAIAATHGEVIEFGRAIGDALGEHVQQLTLNMWIRIAPNSPPHQGIVQIGVADDGLSELSLDVAVNELIVTVGVPGAADPNFAHRLTTRGVIDRDGAWMMVTAVYHGGREADNIELFANGRRIAALSNARGTLDMRGASMRFGTFENPTGPNVHKPFHGGADELMIFRRALSHAEIAALYREATTPIGK